MKRTIIVLFAAMTLFAGCVLPQFEEEEEEEFDPPATVLIANIWANNEFTANSNTHWYKFTATDTRQYIHVSFGTLETTNGLFIQMYNNEGKPEGTRYNLTFFKNYILYTLTIGQEYYIEVTPSSYSGNPIGTYKIAFNGTITSPFLD